jgi:predicted aldo/keto reductase-like oxidoreductase
MKRLDVSHLDFYQVWNIQNPEQFAQATVKGGFVDGIKKARDRGLVGHIGFTSHDKTENLLGYLDKTDWCEILLLVYNIYTTGYAPVLAKAKKKGIGTLVMNPVGGGKLSEDSPVFDQVVRSTGSKSLADLAVRYVAANPDIDTLLCGMTRTSDVDNTIASAARPLTPGQCAEVDAFVKTLAPENTGCCTNCGYCMPCPQEVNIPQVMQAIYNDRILGFKKDADRLHREIGQFSWVPGAGSDACIDCGICLPKCTQKLDIPKEMAWARERFGKK